jgi:hypothetical protein
MTVTYLFRSMKIVPTFIMLLTLSLSAYAGSPRLTQQERADIKAMVANAHHGEPTVLDLSNDQHYRFYMTQLRLAGQAPEMSPQLYTVIKESRIQHRTSGPPDPRRVKLYSFKTVTPHTVTSSDLPAGPIQVITEMGTQDGTNYTASGLHTVVGVPTAMQMTLGLYDINQNPIGTAVNASGYNWPDSLQAEATGILPKGQTEVQAILTYFWQMPGQAAHHGYVVALGSQAPPTEIHVDDPRPKSGQEIIKLCLGRTASDCTYSPEGGTGTNVLMPIKGFITYNSNIDAFTDDNHWAQITMSRPDGGCTISSTDDFFNYATVAGNKLSWNLEPAKFEPACGCLDVNNQAILNQNIRVTISGLPVWVSISNAPDTPTNPYYCKIENLIVVWSCLAEGTNVIMADGSARHIEKIMEQEKIISDQDNTMLTVASVFTGNDPFIMRLMTAQGHDLKLSEGHAVVTPDGVKLAHQLKPGDRVITRSGTATLTRVIMEAYGRNVYNLKVGVPDDGAILTTERRTFFANDILVGGATMQYVYGQKYKRDRLMASIGNIPEEWRQDYINNVVAKKDPGPDDMFKPRN